MATSSIFENIVITDPKVAEAFVCAIEQSEIAQENDKRQPVEGRIATREDMIRLHNMRKQFLTNKQTSIDS